MQKITEVKSRLIYDSRGSKTIELDVITDNKYMGRVSVPSGASIGRNEAINFPNGEPEKCLKLLNNNINKFLGLDPADLKCIHNTIRNVDKTDNYSNIGGAVAFAITIASMESASRFFGVPLFKLLTDESKLEFPIPLGNILGGGLHAGNGTPDIQEILVCPHGAKSIREAIEINFKVHNELRNILQKRNINFTGGKSDEGGWAPEIGNEEALEASCQACESSGYKLGKDISLGIDIAASTQWDQKSEKYRYKNNKRFNQEEQIKFVSDLINRYKLTYVEDAVHQDAFGAMSELTNEFPNVLIAGDDLTVTNTMFLEKAINLKSCNATILKVNQAGSLYDALKFAKHAKKHNIKIITSHRSGETIDSQIVHIGICTGSKMLKIGVVGGERISKINELIRISEYDLIHGMTQL
ncbi:MAG: enolase [Thaumarchaeota archaeon]|nr:enolase [Nitrososphaerota archaeon]